MAADRGFGSTRHLVRRFAGALSPAGPPPDDEAWAEGALLAGERLLWQRMSGPDRRHAVGVARRAIGLLGPDAANRPVVAAALLHDVGKVDGSIGTFGRALVTAAAIAAGRERVARWARRGGSQRSLRRRAGRYLVHDHAGAALLSRAGSDRLTVAWAAEHHLAPERWTIDAAVGAALKAADGD